MVCNKKEIELRFIPNYRTALMDGSLVPDSPKHMATEEFYYATKGSCIKILNTDYEYVVAIYSLDRKPEYIYTYRYEKEENWSTYTKNVSPTDYNSEDYYFSKECYFRICVKRKDGKDITVKDLENSSSVFNFLYEEFAYSVPSYFQEEITDTVNKIKEKNDSNIMKICLLTDTHYTVNGTWQDTAYNIKSVAEKVSYDAIVHLGDLTDGMLSKYMTGKYVKKIIADLEENKAPVYIVPGNHDSNYFYNESNMFTIEEMRSLYQLSIHEKDYSTNGLDYYVDYVEKQVRMIFLSSFDHREKLRYGYTKQQLEWIKKVLKDTKKKTKVLIFSHEAPLGKLDYWSPMVRNGEKLLDILEEYNKKEENQILGFFYGHTHADYVWEECSFPVISIGCNKLEYFEEKKPKDATAQPRKDNHVTQDLWDSLIIDFEKEELHLIRFGAGEDRKVSYRKKSSIYKEKKIKEKKNRKVKVWAHRGASGYAPENTMVAFKLAEEIGADGIELDVQLTKDGIPVIIHDEKIDRVCDGTGWVKDYTLGELQRFNANKSFPNWGKVKIPTLEEVYCWAKDTDLFINLELKNSEIFYEGLEEKVLELAKKYEVEDRILYSSFNHNSMKKIKELQPDARIAFLYLEQMLDMDDYAKRNNASALHPYIKCLEYPEFIAECHRKDIQVNVWTVNDDKAIEKVKSLGIDGIITNYPDKAIS